MEGEEGCLILVPGHLGPDKGQLTSLMQRHNIWLGRRGNLPFFCDFQGRLRLSKKPLYLADRFPGQFVLLVNIASTVKGNIPMTLIVYSFHLVRKMRGYDDPMASRGWAAQAPVLDWNPGWGSQSGGLSNLQFFRSYEKLL